MSNFDDRGRHTAKHIHNMKTHRVAINDLDERFESNFEGLTLEFWQTVDKVRNDLIDNLQFWQRYERDVSCTPPLAIRDYHYQYFQSSWTRKRNSEYGNKVFKPQPSFWVEIESNHQFEYCTPYEERYTRYLNFNYSLPEGHSSMREKNLSNHSCRDPTLWGLNQTWTIIYQEPDTTIAKQDRSQTHTIFRTRCTISKKVYDVIIDCASCTNFVSKRLVKALGLQAEKHPSPYTVRWIKNGGESRVTKWRRSSTSR